jgi:hypothetical protein
MVAKEPHHLLIFASLYLPHREGKDLNYAMVANGDIGPYLTTVKKCGFFYIFLLYGYLTKASL